MFPWWVSWQLRWWASTVCSLTILLSFEQSISLVSSNNVEGSPAAFEKIYYEDVAASEEGKNYETRRHGWQEEPVEEYGRGSDEDLDKGVVRKQRQHVEKHSSKRKNVVYLKNKISNKYQEVFPRIISERGDGGRGAIPLILRKRGEREVVISPLSPSRGGVAYATHRNFLIDNSNLSSEYERRFGLPYTDLNDEPYHYGQSFSDQRQQQDRQPRLPSQNIIFPFKSPRDITSLEVPSGINDLAPDGDHKKVLDLNEQDGELSVVEQQHNAQIYYTRGPPQVVSQVIIPNSLGTGGLQGMGGSAVQPLGPIVQQFATEPAPQTAVVGSTVVMPCRVINKVGHLQWTRNGFGLGTDRDLSGFPRYSMIGSNDEGDFSLRIQPVLLDDDAIFQCQVSAIDGIPGIRSRPARLTVYVPPDPPEVYPQVLKTTAGTEEILECESRGGRPPPEIQWVDDSRRESIQMGSVVTSNSMDDGKRSIVKSRLSFTARRYHNNETITCLTSNQALSAPLTSSILIQVMFPPEVHLTSQPQILIEGDDVKFLCDADANPSQVTYRWFLNGRKILNKTSRVLALENISRSLHKNRISCEVSNRVGTSKKTSNIMIHYGPTFRSMPRDVMAEEGKEATLKCNIDANPSPSIVWLREGSNKIIGSGASLTIQVNTTSGAGIYKCIASVRGRDFDFPELVGRVRLLLKGPPTIVSDSEQQGRLGDTVSIVCSTVSVPSPIRVTWTYNGREIDLNDPRYEVVEDEGKESLRNILVIHDTHSSDFGSYNCSVVNEYGMARKLITLQPEKRVPILVVVGCAVGIVVVAVVVASLVFCNKKHTVKGNSHPEKVFASTTEPIESNNLFSATAETKLIEESTPLPLMKDGMQITPHRQHSTMSYSMDRRKSYQNDRIITGSPLQHSLSGELDLKYSQYEQQIKNDDDYYRYKSQSQHNINYTSSGDFDRRTLTHTSLLTPSPQKKISSMSSDYCTLRRGSPYRGGTNMNQHLSPQHNGHLANSGMAKAPILTNGSSSYCSPQRSPYGSPPSSGAWSPSPRPPPYPRITGSMANGRVSCLSEDTRANGRHIGPSTRSSETKVMFAPGSKLTSGATFI